MDWPVGTDEERAAAISGLPGFWTNSNPFMNRYQIGASGVDTLHTGVDLNLNVPTWNDDWHQPLYAMDWGYVVFQGAGGGSWGHILVIKHWDSLEGRPYYCRYGHLENPRVQAGQVVHPGQTVAQVGNGDGYYGAAGAHLHFDISTTDLLKIIPNEWPGLNAPLLLMNYTDPIAFIVRRKQTMVENPDTTAAYYALLDTLPDNTPVTIIPGVPDPRDPTQEVRAFVLTPPDLRRSATPTVPADPGPVRTLYCTATNGLKVRNAPIAGAQTGSLAYGESADVVDSETAGWLKIVDTKHYGGFVSAAWMSATNPKV